jgi:hypothetical protein
MSAAWLQPLNLPGDIHDNSLTFEYHVRKNGTRCLLRALTGDNRRRGNSVCYRSVRLGQEMARAVERGPACAWACAPLRFLMSG